MQRLLGVYPWVILPQNHMQIAATDRVWMNADPKDSFSIGSTGNRWSVSVISQAMNKSFRCAWFSGKRIVPASSKKTFMDAYSLILSGEYSVIYCTTTYDFRKIAHIMCYHQESKSLRLYCTTDSDFGTWYVTNGCRRNRIALVPFVIELYRLASLF